MSCGTENKELEGKNILATDPELAASLENSQTPDAAQMLAAAKAFVANHHESSKIINKFIDECALNNGVLPAECQINKEETRCPEPTIDVNYLSPSTNFTLSVATSASGIGGPAHDAIQDNSSQGPSQ